MCSIETALRNKFKILESRDSIPDPDNHSFICFSCISNFHPSFQWTPMKSLLTGNTNQYYIHVGLNISG